MLDPWQCKRNRSQQTLPQQESSNTLLLCVLLFLLLVRSCLAWTIQLFIHGPWFSVHALKAILDDDYVFQFPVCSFSSVNRHIETGNGKRIDERVISLFIRLGHVEGLGGGGEEGWDDAVFVCLLFISLPCLRATNALCCSNPFASLVFLVRFLSWAAQVSVAGALHVCSSQNLAFLDLFLRYYRSVLFLFAPAVCFFFFLFFFVLCIFCFVVCASVICLTCPLIMDIWSVFIYSVFLLSLLVRVFFSPLFVVSTTAVWFCVLYSMGEFFFRIVHAMALSRQLGLENFASLVDFFFRFWCFSLCEWTPDLCLFLKRALSNRLLKHFLDPCRPVLRATVIFA